MRVGGVLVPLSTLLRPPELEAQLRTAGVTHLIAAPSFRDRRYLDDLEAVAPGIVAATRGRSPARRPCRPCAASGRSTTCPPTPSTPPSSTRSGDAVRPADDLVVLFTSGSRGVPKGVVHTHGGGLRAVAAGLDARCVHPGERLYVPMPFFWTGGFATGLLSVLVAGATLLTEAIPQPDQTLALLERERVTLFRGWPDQAARLAAQPGFADADLSTLGPGSLPAVLPPDQRPAPGARANIFGMTETFGPYCGSRLDLDLPADERGSCGRPFDGFEVRIVDPDSGDERAPARTARSACAAATSCGRSAGAPVTPPSTPTATTGPATSAPSMPPGTSGTGAGSTTCSRSRGPPCTPPRSRPRCAGVDGVSQAHVTDVATPDGGVEVGALVLSKAGLDEIAAGAKARLSAFKVPTRWVVTAAAGDVPRTATDKVDKAALQALIGREGTER